MGLSELGENFLCFLLFFRIDMLVWMVNLAEMSKGIVDFINRGL